MVKIVLKYIGDMPLSWFFSISGIVYVLGLVALIFGNIVVLKMIPPTFFSLCIVYGVYEYRKEDKK